MVNNKIRINELKESILRLENTSSQLDSLSSDENLSKEFNYRTFSFASTQVKKEIRALQNEIDSLSGKEKSSYSMNITVSLREGMTIKELYKDDPEEFILIKSTVDGEMYGCGRNRIIKLNDEDEDDYICEDLDFFEREVDYFEFKNGRVINDDDEISRKTKLVAMDDRLHEELEEQLNDLPFANYDNDFIDVSFRKISMTIEEFENRTNGSNLPYINFRGKVKDKYDEMKTKEKDDKN